jgi:hypothetical protein
MPDCRNPGPFYYTWSQTQAPGCERPTGEQDVYYTYSTDRGTTWAGPIPLTQEAGTTN